MREFGYTVPNRVNRILDPLLHIITHTDLEAAAVEGINTVYTTALKRVPLC